MSDRDTDLFLGPSTSGDDARKKKTKRFYKLDLSIGLGPQSQTTISADTTEHLTADEYEHEDGGGSGDKIQREPGRDWSTLLYILPTASLAITSGVMWLVFRQAEHGLKTIRQGSSSLRGPAFGYALLLNIMAGLVVFCSGAVRKRLLSPSPEELLSRRNQPPAPTLATFLAAPWPRQIMWLLILFLSLSTHLFVNTLIMRSEPAHDAYQVLVDGRFFDGAPLNVATANLTRFPDEPDPVVPYGTAWPEEWPGVAFLQSSLQTLQQALSQDEQGGPSEWRNLTEADCRKQYGDGTYSHYRNLVMVTNWTDAGTADLSGHRHNNNSVLAVAGLPGSDHFTRTTRLKALCPSAYLELTPNAFFPDSAKYVEGLSDNKNRNESEHLRKKYKTETELMAGTYRSHDMCYDYRPQQPWEHPDSYNWTEQLALSYCLSEPIPDAEERIVWNTLTGGILTVILTALTLAMAGTWLLLLRDGGFPGGYPWPRCRYCGPVRGLQVYFVASLALIALAEVLASKGRDVFRGGIPPPRDGHGGGSFTLAITVYANLLHPVIALREIMLANVNDGCYYIMYGGRWRDMRPGTLKGYDIIYFVMDLGLHLFATAWSAVSLTDRYSLSAIGRRDAASIPTLKPVRPPFQDTMDSLVWAAPPVAVFLHFCPFGLLWAGELRRSLHNIHF